MNRAEIEKAVDDALRRWATQRFGDTSRIEWFLELVALSGKLATLKDIFIRTYGPAAQPEAEAVVAKLSHAIEPHSRANSLNEAKEALEAFLIKYLETAKEATHEQ